MNAGLGIFSTYPICPDCYSFMLLNICLTKKNLFLENLQNKLGETSVLDKFFKSYLTKFVYKSRYKRWLILGSYSCIIIFLTNGDNVHLKIKILIFISIITLVVRIIIFVLFSVVSIY